MTELPARRVACWGAVDGLVHGFLGRRGGVSVGSYASLNLSERLADEPAAVAENRRRVAASLADQGCLVWMHQVHGDHVAVVAAASADVGEADAMVSAQPGTLLAVLTADCVPAILVAPRRRVAAIVHAGWRGTVAGIVHCAVEVMRTNFGVVADEIEAALGPSIGGCCYEVEFEIGESFVRRWGALPADGWAVRGRKGQLDLRAANAHLLQGAGIPGTQIHRVGPCTRCAVDEYFSHRGSNGHTGRQLSYVGWAK